MGLSQAPAVAVDLGGLQLPSAPMQLTQEDLEEATWGLRNRLWAPLARMGLRSCIHWQLWWVLEDCTEVSWARALHCC